MSNGMTIFVQFFLQGSFRRHQPRKKDDFVIKNLFISMFNLEDNEKLGVTFI